MKVHRGGNVFFKERDSLNIIYGTTALPYLLYLHYCTIPFSKTLSRSYVLQQKLSATIENFKPSPSPQEKKIARHKIEVQHNSMVKKEADFTPEKQFPNEKLKTWTWRF